MRTNLTLFLLLILTITGCDTKKDKILSSFGVFCEMVANDAKPIALGHPMVASELDQYWDEFQSIADSYNVSLYRETTFPVTSLFPASVTDGMEVVVIYNEPRLVQYQQFKADLNELEHEEAARRFGRLLGYTPQGINELLMKNTDFRTLSSFGVNQQITHLYYEDLEEGMNFYGEVLGLPFDEEVGFKIGANASIQLHPYDEEHPAGQPKSTAIALLTDQLPEWYTYAQEQEIPIKYTYKPREGGPHDGFVAIDPEGYLLEFEEFKQHPENELFMATLEEAPRVFSSIDSLNFFGSITWTYHNDLLKMQKFYEEDLGFRMVADQGWTKIYQTSSNGYIGLVDERRGMMDYAGEKAIEVEWRIENSESASEYFSSMKTWSNEKNGFSGPERYLYLLK